MILSILAYLAYFAQFYFSPTFSAINLKEKQAQEGNSCVRLEMTNQMLRNVEMLRNVKKVLKNIKKR